MIEDLINKSIDTATEFFRRNGIVTSRPTFTYTGIYSPQVELMLAQVPGSIGRQLSQSLTQQKLMKYVPRWFSKKCVQVSADAVKEYVALSLARMSRFDITNEKTMTLLTSYGSDILYFRAVEDIVEECTLDDTKNILEQITVHELWHVVEQRTGFPPNLIMEGTAEFARMLYVEQKALDKPSIIKPSDEGFKEEIFRRITGKDLSSKEARSATRMLKNMYTMGLRVARKYASTLHDLLDADKRAKMEGDISIEVDKALEEVIRKEDGTLYSVRGTVSRVLWPELSIL